MITNTDDYINSFNNKVPKKGTLLSFKDRQSNLNDVVNEGEELLVEWNRSLEAFKEGRPSKNAPKELKVFYKNKNFIEDLFLPTTALIEYLKTLKDDQETYITKYQLYMHFKHLRKVFNIQFIDCVFI